MTVFIFDSPSAAENAYKEINSCIGYHDCTANHNEVRMGSQSRDPGKVGSICRSHGGKVK